VSKGLLKEFDQMTLAGGFDGNAVFELHSIAPVVLTSASPASGGAPRARISGIEKSADNRVTEGSDFDAEAMQQQIRTLRSYGKEDLSNLLRTPIATADTSDANPHPRLEAVSVHADVSHVVFRSVSLKNWHDVDAGVTSQQSIVPLDSEPLMILNSQAGLGEHERLAHIVLSDGGYEVAELAPINDVSCVFLNRMRIAVVHLDGAERSRVENPFINLQSFSSAQSMATHDHGSNLLMPSIGRVMNASEELAHREILA